MYRGPQEKFISCNKIKMKQGNVCHLQEGGKDLVNINKDRFKGEEHNVDL